MRESASTDLREPQGSNPLGPPGPELNRLCLAQYRRCRDSVRGKTFYKIGEGGES
jgi:hypothetical protein